MNTKLIKYFNAALVESGNQVNFTELNRYAMERGYLVHPEVCTHSVYDFLEGETINCNATFYKEWEDIEKRDRLDILFDQLLHYLTRGEYVPNAEGGVNIPYNTFKVIMPITDEELFDKCYDVLCSGIALKQETMLAMADYVIDFFGNNAKEAFVDVDAVKNKEAQVYLCDELDITPKDKFSLFRYIIYKTTGKSMYVKNAETIRAIQNSTNQFSFRKLTNEQMVALSSIFLRFKPLFLAFKKVNESGSIYNPRYKKSGNVKYINKLRKLAVTNHTPLKTGIMNDIYNPENSLDEVKKHLGEVTLFKIAALMQGCRARINDFDKTNVDRVYVVRNQKTYMKNMDITPDLKKSTYYHNLYITLREYLVEKLRDKAGSVKFPENYQLVVPTSEKSFVGNYPFGTHFNMNDKNNFIGIYWKGEWGTQDFDLSYQDVNGGRIGWNSYWNNGEVLFSGDMVQANPEASEVLYFKNGVRDGLIYVNRYNGKPGSKYKMFFGQEKVDANKFKKGYMVDPNNVQVTVDLESPENMQQSVGMIFDNHVYLMELTNANIRVANSNTRYEQCMRDKAKTFVDLKSILLEAGFYEYQPIYDEEGKLTNPTPDVDLVNLDKSTLIKLFS